MLDSEDLKEQALDEEKSQKLLHEVVSKEELVPPMEMKGGVLGKGDSCIDLGQGGEPEKQVNGQYQIQGAFLSDPSPIIGNARQ